MSVTSVAQKWVSEAAGLTQPSRVVWCDGSKAEYDSLIEAMLQDGTLLPLNPKTYPNCYLHRSPPSDVARTEQLTFICSRDSVARYLPSIRCSGGSMAYTSTIRRNGTIPTASSAGEALSNLKSAIANRQSQIANPPAPTDGFEPP